MDKTEKDNLKTSYLLDSLKSSAENFSSNIEILETSLRELKKSETLSIEIAIKMAKWGRNNPYGFISEKDFEEVAEKQFNEFVEKKKTSDNKEKSVINFFKERFESLKKRNSKRSAFESAIHETKVQFNYTSEQVYPIADKAMRELDKEYMEFL